MSKRDTLIICFAVNDDNGNHSGIAEAFSFDDELLYLAGGFTACYRVGLDKLRVGRRTYPIISYRTWHGNIVWDAARMERAVAERLAEYLRGTGKWDAEMGTTAVLTAWHRGTPIRFGEE